ncbi:MAG: substrate-binding domain-containing protein, partial [Anaerolineales bacterium]
MLAAVGVAAASACGPSRTAGASAYPQVAVTSAIDEIAAGWLAAYREEAGPPAFELLPMPPSQAMDRAESGDIALAISVADPPLDWFATPLSTDALAVIVHTANAVPDLSLAELRGLFSGGISNWDELGGADLAVQPYLPYPDDDLRIRFEAAVMGGLRPAGVVFLVPHSRAAREAVAADRSAVGLIPASMVDDTVRA